MSFIDYFKQVPLNQIINLLETNQEIIYYETFDINTPNLENCKNNYLYNLYHKNYFIIY